MAWVILYQAGAQRTPHRVVQSCQVLGDPVLSVLVTPACVYKLVAPLDRLLYPYACLLGRGDKQTD